MGRIIIFLWMAISFLGLNPGPTNAGEIYHVALEGTITLPELASAGVTVVSHVPYEKEFLAEAKKYGIKVLPYISISRVYNSLNDPLMLRHPFWKEVDASKHPEWFCIDEDGKVHRFWGQTTYSGYPAFDSVCRTQQSYCDAVVRGVGDLMKMGAGGVFIDECSPSPFHGYCYGGKLGIHNCPIEDPRKNTIEGFRTTLKALCTTVKKYGDDKLVIRNSGSAPFWYAKEPPPLGEEGDATMLESFVYRSNFGTSTMYSSKDEKRILQIRSNTPPPSFGPFWKNFAADYFKYKKYQEEIPISAMTYLIEPCSGDESAFYSFVYAKLLDMKMWNSSFFPMYGDFLFSLSRCDMVRRLYRVFDMGKLTTTRPTIKEEYGYGVFEKGTVVINPDRDKEVTVEVPVSQLKPPLAELYSGRELEIKDGKVRLILPPESGRVILTKEEVLRNYLREIKGQILTIRRYAEDNILKFKNPKFHNKNILLVLNNLEKKTDEFLKNPSAIKSDAIDKFTLDVSLLTCDSIIRDVLPIIKDNAEELNREDIMKLVELPGATLSNIELYAENKVKKTRLRSAGATYVIPPYSYGFDHSYFIQYGRDTYFNLVSGPMYMASSSAIEALWYPWNNYINIQIEIGDVVLVPNQFKDIKVTMDNDECKRIEGVVTLRDEKKEIPVQGKSTVAELLTMEDIWEKYDENNIYLQVIFEIKKGKPFLYFDCALIKNGVPAEGKILLQILGGKWQINPFDGMAPTFTDVKDLLWICYLQNPDAVSGTLVLGEPLLVVSGNYIISEKGRLRISFAPIQMNESYFIEERLRNLKLYTGLVAQLIHQTYMKIYAPEVAEISKDIFLQLSVDNKGGSKVEKINCFLTAEVVYTRNRETGWLTKQGRQRIEVTPLSDPVVAAVSNDQYICNIDSDVAVMNDILAISYGADVVLEGGVKYRLENFKWIRIGESEK